MAAQGGERTRVRVWDGEEIKEGREVEGARGGEVLAAFSPHRLCSVQS